MRVLGIITARGGSKGIPGKNLKPLAGRPLLAYTLEAARESGAFDRLILSTDDPAIAEYGRAQGCDVPFLRPPELARDDTPHLPVIQHAVSWVAAHQAYRPDLVTILQPTSPFRRASDLQGALARLGDTGADSIVSVSEVPAHMNPMRMLRVDEDGRAVLFVTGEPVRRRINRRQDMPPAWVMNGAIYACRAAVLSGPSPSLYGASTVTWPMGPPFDLSIDTPEDWEAAERACRWEVAEKPPTGRITGGKEGGKSSIF